VIALAESVRQLAREGCLPVRMHSSEIQTLSLKLDQRIPLLSTGGEYVALSFNLLRRYPSLDRLAMHFQCLIRNRPHPRIYAVCLDDLFCNRSKGHDAVSNGDVGAHIPVSVLLIAAENHDIARLQFPR
jgi:hypothetical protein